MLAGSSVVESAFLRRNRLLIAYGAINIAGVTMRVKIVAKLRPETIEDASSTQKDATGPPTSISLDNKSMDTPLAIGSKPKPVVNVVRNTGRNRKQPV